MRLAVKFYSAVFFLGGGSLNANNDILNLPVCVFYYNKIETWVGMHTLIVRQINCWECNYKNIVWDCAPPFYITQRYCHLIKASWTQYFVYCIYAGGLSKQQNKHYLHLNPTGRVQLGWPCLCPSLLLRTCPRAG